jgi:MFS family permease
MLMLGDLFRIGYAPPCYSVLMNFTPPPLRGSVMSIMQLTTNVVGFGLGPLIVGMLSDLFGGQTALRYAMASALSLLILAAALLAASARLLYGRAKSIRSDLRA